MTGFDKIWEDIVKGTVACRVCGEMGDTAEMCPASSPDPSGKQRTMGNCDRRRNSEVPRHSHMVRQRRKHKKERGG
jgi:hypothetical protein